MAAVFGLFIFKSYIYSKTNPFMLLFYFRSALRGIGKKRFFSFLNITGLAVGICLFLLSLEFYSYERGFNRWHPHLSQLYRLNINTSFGKSASTFPPIAPLMQQHIPGVRKACRYADNFNDGAIVSYQSGSAPLRSFREEGCVFVDASFLDAFHFPLIKGSNELEKTNTVVITAPIAKKLFGSKEPVGQTLHLHNQFGDLPVTVVGVTAEIPEQSDIRFSYLFSIGILNNPGYTKGSDWARLDNWGNDAYTTYVWLEDKTDPATVAAAASTLWKKSDPGYERSKGAIILQSVATMHLGKDLHDDAPVYASMGLTWFILALGILVLAIAWINYINFSTADTLSRAREIGIHKMVGSRRRQIVGRYLTESLLLNLLGLLIALVLAWATQDLFNYITKKPLSLHYIDHPSTWLMIATVLLTGVLLCGGYVGALLSRFKPIAILQFNHTGNMGNVLLRKGLIVFQLTISCIFIMSTLVAYRQISFMKTHDLGMDIDRLIVIQGPAIKDSTYKLHASLFKDELQRLPFIEKLSCTGSVPGVGFAHNFAADGITGASPRKGDDHTNYYISEVDEAYFDTYRIPLVQGTNFTTEDANKSFKGDILIINETAARGLGYDPAQAVGKIINWGKQYKIRAVVKDYHHRSLKEAIEPILYIPQHNNACYTIKVDPDRLTEKMASVRRIYENLYPGNSFEYAPLKETYDQLYTEEQRAGVIALSLSILVITIAGLGLIGLSTFTARRRTKEMGIRKVLGASTLSLFTQLSKEFVWLVIVSLFIAIPIAWMGIHKWLENYSYRTEISWWLFILTGVICMLLTLLTVSFQAIRAARVNPVENLRTE